ncbi:caspase family protein [Duganella aceris]|uniref:Caspase family protein n=1 Tax=Duganella aceris TaxID=2703883 RepID=A0ABX0FPI9_9BURK|nr:caspase family protein [Duganella aceris]NGZ86444.1 caspase family protein [Duganella aceris]
MKKSLAILIGVSEYDDTTLNLPPCVNDVQLMEKVVLYGGRFTDVVCLPSTDAAVLKNALAGTIQRFAHEDVETLLFYYSGHGEFTENSFRFLLKDFSKQKASSTSLAMSDLDQMFRSLNPETMVKVIDACYSGAPIIKSSEQLRENIFDKGLFKNCYFLFSSHSDQRSYAEIGLSDFTKNIVKSISESEVPEIRFQQLISSLTDAFSQNQRQTPMFVTQGSGLHSLGEYSEDARDKLSKFVDSPSSEAVVYIEETVGEAAEVKALSLFERASAHAKKYVSRDTAEVLLDAVKCDLLGAKIDSQFAGMYEAKIEFEVDPNKVPFRKGVGIWLHNNAASEYFMLPEYYEEEYEIPISEFELVHIFRKKRTRTRSVVHGFRTGLHGLPFVAASLEMNPLLENLKKYGMWLTFALSKTHITFFYAFVNYLENGWGDYSAEDAQDFNIQKYSLTASAPQEMVSGILNDFMIWVRERAEVELDRQDFN